MKLGMWLISGFRGFLATCNRVPSSLNIATLNNFLTLATATGVLQAVAAAVSVELLVSSRLR